MLAEVEEEEVTGVEPDAEAAALDAALDVALAAALATAAASPKATPMAEPMEPMAVAAVEAALPVAMAAAATAAEVSPELLETLYVAKEEVMEPAAPYATLELRTPELTGVFKIGDGSATVLTLDVPGAPKAMHLALYKSTNRRCR